MPKLICPKVSYHTLVVFRLIFVFLYREICHQKFKNDGHKCDFVGGNVRSYPTISSLEYAKSNIISLCCGNGKILGRSYKIDESNNMMENVGKVSFNAAFWSVNFGF